MFYPKASRVNSISEAERPKRSRVSPSEAIPTFLPFPRPGTASGQEPQGRITWSRDRNQKEGFIHPEVYIPRLVLCWYSENAFIDRDWDFIFWVIRWSRAEILLPSRYKHSPAHNQMCTASGMFSVPNLISPVCKSEVDIVASSGLARLAACLWLGDDYFLATIITPSANQGLVSAQSDQSEARMPSLNITFLPPSVLPLMGHRQDHYYAGVRTGKLNLDTKTTSILKCLLHCYCYKFWPWLTEY